MSEDIDRDDCYAFEVEEVDEENHSMRIWHNPSDKSMRISSAAMDEYGITMSVRSTTTIFTDLSPEVFDLLKQHKGRMLFGMIRTGVILEVIK